MESVTSGNLRCRFSSRRPLLHFTCDANKHAFFISQALQPESQPSNSSDDACIRFFFAVFFLQPETVENAVGRCGAPVKMLHLVLGMEKQERGVKRRTSCEPAEAPTGWSACYAICRPGCHGDPLRTTTFASRSGLATT